MSNKAINSALDFYPAEPATGPGFFGTVKAIFESIGEGFAAARRYQQLTGRGVPAGKAAETVFNEHFKA